MVPARIRLMFCRRRVLRLEKAISRMLAAYDAGEMSNYQEALKRLRDVMEEI